MQKGSLIMVCSESVPSDELTGNNRITSRLPTTASYRAAARNRNAEYHFHHVYIIYFRPRYVFASASSGRSVSA
jgi:hypothetical protein